MHSLSLTRLTWLKVKWRWTVISVNICIVYIIIYLHSCGDKAVSCPQVLLWIISRREELLVVFGIAHKCTVTNKEPCT